MCIMFGVVRGQEQGIMLNDNMVNVGELSKPFVMKVGMLLNNYTQ